MSETKAIRVSVETHDRLQSLADKSDRTISATAERLLKPALTIKELSAEQAKSVQRIEAHLDAEAEAAELAAKNQQGVGTTKKADQ